jgi:4-amino-4-deoxy-L-arabinose transferase-like glycosyltransferase
MANPLLLRETDSHSHYGYRLCNIFLTDTQLILFVLLLITIVYMVSPTDNLFPGGDNARYLILAKALLTGNGYRNIGTIAESYHTLAPPGFPLLLSGIIAIFGMNVILSKILVGMFGVLSVAIVYALFKRDYGTHYAAGIALLYGTAPLAVMYARRVYSDLPFVVISLLALWAVDRYSTDQSLFSKWALLSGLGLAVAFYLRPVALALLLASTLWLISKKKLMQGALLFLSVALLIAPWYRWVQHVSTDVVPGHFSIFLSQGGLYELLNRALINCVSYTRLFAENLSYVTTKGLEHIGLTGSLISILQTITLIGICPLIITGFIHCMQNKLSLSEVYVVVYCSVLLSYGYILDRFIIPLLPFVVHYCIQGLQTLAKKIIPHNNKRAILKITNGLLIYILLSNSMQILARLYQERNFAIFAPTAAKHYDIARWASTHLMPTAIIATEYPDFFYVYANRKAVSLHKDVMRMIEEGIVQFYIADTSQNTQVQAWIHELNDNFETVSSYCINASEFCLYEIIRITDK